jgi:hypothetical protein
LTVPPPAPSPAPHRLLRVATSCCCGGADNSQQKRGIGAQHRSVA